MVNTYVALDIKIANEFHNYAKQTKEYPHDYGEMRSLRVSLQNLCGITELEAINVLLSRNVADYIAKYNIYYLPIKMLSKNDSASVLP